jgi:hypothetical protein
VDKRVAVVGWQWYRLIEDNKTVRMVPDRVWQWQYWMNDDPFKKVAVAGVADDKKDTNRDTVDQQVAVVGWQWYRWIARITAVPMVPVSMHGWQY